MELYYFNPDDHTNSNDNISISWNSSRLYTQRQKSMTRDKGGPRSQKKFFSTLRASVWSKNKGGGRAPRTPLDPQQFSDYCFTVQLSVDLLQPSNRTMTK